MDQVHQQLSPQLADRGINWRCSPPGCLYAEHEAGGHVLSSLRLCAWLDPVLEDHMCGDSPPTPQRARRGRDRKPPALGVGGPPSTGGGGGSFAGCFACLPPPKKIVIKKMLSPSYHESTRAEAQGQLAPCCPCTVHRAPAGHGQ
jgi:hypothetical protein